VSRTASQWPWLLTTRPRATPPYNPEHHQKVRHIERRHFYVRECVENHQITVPYVNTVDNLADFFTKPLEAKEFFRMRNVIMNVPSYSAYMGRMRRLRALLCEG